MYFDEVIPSKHWSQTQIYLLGHIFKKSMSRGSTFRTMHKIPYAEYFPM